jgi:hypothetical protein
LWLHKNHVEKKLHLENLIDTFFDLAVVNKLRKNLFNNWNSNNQFYFTLNFNNEPDCVSACMFVSSALRWLTNKNFIKFIVDNFTSELKDKVTLIRIIKHELTSSYTANLLLEHS